MTVDRAVGTAPAPLLPMDLSTEMLSQLASQMEVRLESMEQLQFQLDVFLQEDTAHSCGNPCLHQQHTTLICQRIQRSTYWKFGSG